MLMRCINFLDKAGEGTIEVGDIKVEMCNCSKKDIFHIRHKPSMLFKNYNLFKNKTALENITMPLVIGRKWTRIRLKK